jgi:hypothetical protein
VIVADALIPTAEGLVVRVISMSVKREIVVGAWFVEDAVDTEIIEFELWGMMVLMMRKLKRKMMKRTRS